MSSRRQATLVALHRRPARWLLLLACAGLSGCHALVDKPSANYRTVQASPNRDTPTAAAEHEKALRILDRCECDYCCECVNQALCNPCKAEEHLQNALIADVRYGPAHNTLGSLYLGQQKLYLAAWEFEYAARLMPERPEPLNNLGLVYEAAGKLGRAITAYEQAAEIAPNNPETLGNLARAHLRQGTPFEEVRYVLEQVVFYDTRPGWVGWAKEQLGVHPMPHDHIQGAIYEVFPDDFSGEVIDAPTAEAQAPLSESGSVEGLPELVNPMELPAAPIRKLPPVR